MASIYSLLKSRPLWLLAGAVAALLVVLAVILCRYLAGKHFLKILKKVSANPELAPALIGNRYSKGALLRKSGLIERFIRKNGADIIRLCAIDSLWVDNLVLKKRKKDFLRVLKYAPEIGLFKCFLLPFTAKIRAHMDRAAIFSVFSVHERKEVTLTSLAFARSLKFRSSPSRSPRSVSKQSLSNTPHFSR